MNTDASRAATATLHQQGHALDLLVNGVAINRTSLGARRYYDGIMEQLAWPGQVRVTPLPRRRSMERISELCQRGYRDAIFWSPSHRGPLRAHNHVFTVLDCINVEYTYRNDWRLPMLRSFMNVTLAGASCVVAISNATRDAILDNFRVDERKVIAIPGPIEFGPPQVRAVMSDREVSDKPFILMITNALPHKNTARALGAIAASRAAREGVAVKIVGSADPLAIQHCERQGVEVQVHRGVSDEVLNGWLAQALFLFSPSLQEGLNLPVAEALGAGTRVLCSDIPVHREFYQGRASMCDPIRVGAMVEAIDAAIGGAWPETDATLRPRPTFSDVAAGYRTIFTQISAAHAGKRASLTF